MQTGKSASDWALQDGRRRAIRRAELPSVGFPVGDFAPRTIHLRAGGNILARASMVGFRSAQTSTAARGASMPNLEIMWTKVDEAPALATYSLLPIVETF